MDEVRALAIEGVRQFVGKSVVVVEALPQEIATSGVFRQLGSFTTTTDYSASLTFSVAALPTLKVRPGSTVPHPVVDQPELIQEAG